MQKSLNKKTNGLNIDSVRATARKKNYLENYVFTLLTGENIMCVTRVCNSRSAAELSSNRIEKGYNSLEFAISPTTKNAIMVPTIILSSSHCARALQRLGSCRGKHTRAALRKLASLFPALARSRVRSLAQRRALLSCKTANLIVYTAGGFIDS